MLNKIKNFLSTNKWIALTCFSLFFVPLSAIVPIRGADIWYNQYLSLFIVLFFGISIKLWEFNKLISIFVFYSTMSTIFVMHMLPRSILILVQITLCSLGVMCISRMNRKHVKLLFKTIVFLAIVQGFYVILQYFNLDPIFDNISNRSVDDTVGFSGNHNQIGLFFAMVTPLIMYYFPVILVLVVFSIYCSTTTIAWIAMVSSLVYFSYFKFRKHFISVLIILTGISIFYVAQVDVFSFQKLEERTRLWKFSILSVEKGKIYPRYNNVIRVVTCNKWFGFGNGSFMMYSPGAQKDAGITEYVDGDKGVKSAPHVYEHAHNDYIEFFFDYGILGAIILFLFMADLMYKFLSSKKTKILVISAGCLMSFSICVTFIYGVQTAISGMLLMIFLGIFLGEVRRQRYGQVSVVG